MLDKRTLDTIRSQAEAGEFAHYGGMMVQDLLNHIDALTEQVRVLRGALSESEFAMNAVKNDVPWHVKDECMFDEALHIARRALAALEGE